MTPPYYEVVVIGGGPAGIAAALEAAAGGAKVLLIDASESTGGNYYKAPPASFKGAGSWLDTGRKKQHLLLEAALQSSKVEIARGVQVWGVFDGVEKSFGSGEAPSPFDGSRPFSLYLDNPLGSSRSLQAGTLVVAPGVYDRPLPFNGWTLPGVITPGGAQIMLKKQGLLPGKRVVVAGTGPLQMAVAANLAEEGAEVAALLDTSPAFAGLQRLPGAVWGQGERLVEGAQYLFSLLKRRVPVLFQHAVLRATGTPESGLREVVIGKVDVKGYPVPGSERTLEADTLCIAYGFAPSIELTLHLGCSHSYHPRFCLFFPDYDERMQTNVKGVFVAGDITGVGGKQLAGLQGRLAGISALEALGRLSSGQAEKLRSRLQPAMARQERMANLLWERFHILPGLLDIIKDDAVVCRCEGITAGEIRASCLNGARNLRGVKLRTRLGMGICQGRYCNANAAMIAAGALKKPIEEMGVMKVRPPIVPVRLKDIL